MAIKLYLAVAFSLTSCSIEAPAGLVVQVSCGAKPNCAAVHFKPMDDRLEFTAVGPNGIEWLGSQDHVPICDATYLASHKVGVVICSAQGQLRLLFAHRIPWNSRPLVESKILAEAQSKLCWARSKAPNECGLQTYYKRDTPLYGQRAWRCPRQVSCHYEFAFPE